MKLLIIHGPNMNLLGLFSKNRFISNETVALVKKFLEKGDQVLFFINRRGFAPYLICKKCVTNKHVLIVLYILHFINSKIKQFVIIVVLISPMVRDTMKTQMFALTHLGKCVIPS